MRYKVVLLITLITILGLTGCTNKEIETNTVIDNSSIDSNEEQAEVKFKATVLETYENGYLIEPLEGSNELSSADRITINSVTDEEIKVGNIIEIIYDGMIAESYPAQISNVYDISVVESAEYVRMIMIEDKLYKDTGEISTLEGRCGTLGGSIKTRVECWKEPTENGQANFEEAVGYQYGTEANTIEIQINNEWIIFKTEDDIVYYNGKAYDKSKLSDSTLNWLEMTEHDRLLSSYFPSEFIENSDIWGISLSAESITNKGLKLIITQTNGYHQGELQTGSWFKIEHWDEESNEWISVKEIIDNAAWTSEAYLIAVETSSEYNINWEWVYGELSAGKYRLCKEITDFKNTGDYDSELYFVEFEIN